LSIISALAISALFDTRVEKLVALIAVIILVGASLQVKSQCTSGGRKPLQQHHHQSDVVVIRNKFVCMLEGKTNRVFLTSASQI